MKRILLHRAGIRWAVALIFEPRDLWVGVYWDRYWEMGERPIDLYICIVPMLPIRLSYAPRRKK